MKYLSLIFCAALTQSAGAATLKSGMYDCNLGGDSMVTRTEAGYQVVWQQRLMPPGPSLPDQWFSTRQTVTIPFDPNSPITQTAVAQGGRRFVSSILNSSERGIIVHSDRSFTMLADYVTADYYGQRRAGSPVVHWKIMWDTFRLESDRLYEFSCEYSHGGEPIPRPTEP